MKVGQTYDVTPTGVSSRGEATVVVEGKVVYVIDGPVGKRVKIEITRIFDRYAYAIALR